MTRAGSFLTLSADRYPDRPCFVFGDGSHQTFAETNSRVNRLADALSTAGVSTGGRVAVVATDSGGYVEVLLACMKLGATYVPLNNRLQSDELLTLLRRAEPTALFASSRYLEVCRALAPQVGSIRLVGAFDGEPAPGVVPFEELVDSGTDVEPDVPVSDDDVLGLAFTSGTTGLPKGVLQPQRMVKSLVVNMSIDYEIVPDEFRYTASPIFHIAGQAMILMHVWRGFPTLVLPQFEPSTVLRWMQSGRLTGAFLVPTMVSTLLEHPDIGAGSYANLRSIIYGGAPMSPALLRRALDVFGCDFINAFGAATEGGLQSVLSSADHRRALAGAPHLLGSIGKPAFGVELRLVDEAGADVPRGEVGEIITRSDPVMTGYLEMPEETARAIRDGWFWGGDLARMDDEGYLYLAGRSKDMIIRGGENIYPVEIETVLADHPSVAQVAVVGRPDDHWGEVVVAFVTGDPAGPAPDPEVLREHCRAHLAAFKVPVEVTVVDAMPLNASGKILKRTLRERLSSPAPA
ncbi:class I adenylate-forming enzyme family protein [Petropleomorpha daqingensis]|uniref:Acyl-CoA synthetase (AMP-forming)/AMP-acid ligase II n=1 Tax=Petropleomorpha daqingensis TaxID=2026353 RepID=A0A853CLB1_9ACTN|nr:AMP-binding protein [Petropleomorpha daqingensis]NYJ08715.1 acyl-CoA synthetase (AMP-forming)/AMP-acid ligase II [Petropleomorpha daqingensis]